jgi:hypothetical protein
MISPSDFLDRVLDPVGSALGPEAAQRLIALRANPEVQQRVDELAERANEGEITPEERSEYEALITAATIVGILQAKARALLRITSANA